MPCSFFFLSSLKSNIILPYSSFCTQLSVAGIMSLVLFAIANVHQLVHFIEGFLGDFGRTFSWIATAYIVPMLKISLLSAPSVLPIVSRCLLTFMLG